MSQAAFRLKGAAIPIRVISLDITGTLLVHAHPIYDTYASCAIWAGLDNPPSRMELKDGFKKSYKSNLLQNPCFGGKLMSDKDWWKNTVRDALKVTGREYSSEDFARYFRRVYQHYGSPSAYERLSDADFFLNWLLKLNTEMKASSVILGVTSNAPLRTIDSVLPMKGLHDSFKFFVSSQEVGQEKPHPDIFEATYEQAKFWAGPDLQRCEILHIGDSLEADFCGARSAGFQALLLDRSDTPKVNKYQDWLQVLDYPGKSPEDIDRHTVTDFHQVIARFDC